MTAGLSGALFLLLAHWYKSPGDSDGQMSLPASRPATGESTSTMESSDVMEMQRTVAPSLGVVAGVTAEKPQPSGVWPTPHSSEDIKDRLPNHTECLDDLDFNPRGLKLDLKAKIELGRFIQERNRPIAHLVVEKRDAERKLLDLKQSQGLFSHDDPSALGATIRKIRLPGAAEQYGYVAIMPGESREIEDMTAAIEGMIALARDDIKKYIAELK